MKSGRFLLVYTCSNAVLLVSCAAYIAATRRLEEKEDNALILPQILAVIPGTPCIPDTRFRIWYKNLIHFFRLLLCFGSRHSSARFETLINASKGSIILHISRVKYIHARINH